MKIHAYQLEEGTGYSFAETLRHIANLPMEDRFLSDDPNSIRLEGLRESGGLLLADFVKRRNHGPGRLRRGSAIEGFSLNVNEGDGFGEETALICDLHTNVVVIQYNHFGPRALAIVDYVDEAEKTFLHADRIDEQVFDFAMILQQDAYTRLRAMNIYRSLELKISVPAVASQDLQAGRGLGSVLRAPMGGVENITIQYSTFLARDSSLTPDGVLGVVNQARRMGDSVRRLVVKGKTGREERTEEINLFNDRLEARAEIVVGPDGRYPRDARWRALSRQYRSWRSSGALGVP